MAWKHIISQNEARDLLGQADVKFVDASWYLPAQNRNGFAEYQDTRIPGAVFFDIDAISDQSSDLPHMLPTPEAFAEAVGTMGIANDDRIIVYDGPGMFSAPRVWWTFTVMGARNVKVLEGGIDGWKAAGLPTQTGAPTAPELAIFTADLDTASVADMEELVTNTKSREAAVLDARPFERFTGEAAEPRPGLRSGHIPGACSTPASSLVAGGTLRSTAELQEIFAQLALIPEDKIITSCGSGVTAAIIALALAETGYQNVKLYDGSWAEWGMPDGPDLETGS